MCSVVLLVYMSTTIGIKEERKLELQKLAASIFLDEGKKLTAQEHLSRVIDFAVEHKEELIKQKNCRTNRKDTAWTSLNRLFKTGIRDLASSVDKTLYDCDQE